MQIVSGDNLHEVSRSYFLGKVRKIFQNVVCCIAPSVVSVKCKRQMTLLILKALITNAALDNLNLFLGEKIRIDISNCFLFIDDISC